MAATHSVVLGNIIDGQLNWFILFVEAYIIIFLVCVFVVCFLCVWFGFLFFCFFKFGAKNICWGE